MKIKLTENQIKSVQDEVLIIDGEEIPLLKSIKEGQDDNGRWEYYLFHSKISDKFWEVKMYYCRYGYEDYGFEMSEQDGYAYEVEKKQIIKTAWVRVE